MSVHPSVRPFAQSGPPRRSDRDIEHRIHLHLYLLEVRKESDSECCVVVHLDDMYIHVNHDDVSMS